MTLASGIPKSVNVVSGKSTENYLKTIYDLSRNGKPISTTKISRALKVSPASVTEMIKKLAEQGQITYSPYRGVTLTSNGRHAAEKTVRKHRLLERFLHDVLKIDNVKVHSEACAMEHALSDAAAESLCRFLRHPDSCPDDGKIIPPCDLQIENCEECIQLHGKGLEEAGKHDQSLVSITNLKEGQRGKISFIRGGHNVLKRLLDMGLTPGTEVHIVRVAPLGGPVELSVRNSKLALGKGVASKIFIDVAKTS